jgi:hypothetical protein
VQLSGADDVTLNARWCSKSGSFASIGHDAPHCAGAPALGGIGAAHSLAVFGPSLTGLNI